MSILSSSKVVSGKEKTMLTVTKQDIIDLGYGISFAADIIRQSKLVMVDRGYPFYQSRKVNRVPVDVVEEILGITLSENTLDYINK
ncbi:DUF3173 domain-containing protein [Erysipelothrix rhusiopathiae]|uniref:DUF3173 domain-containing protein n=2 Tax=Erysipelothrix rhusiopathiae TaxID=1648 RepID=UPI00248186B4|nr:DUF3173 domain-containing protein [Erysipelothrix rhusiopathiae]